MDTLPLQPEQRSGQVFQPSVEDYGSDESDSINIFGNANVSTKRSKFPNMNASKSGAAKEAMNTRDINMRSDSGHSSFNIKTAPNADSSSRKDGVRLSFPFSKHARGVGYLSSPGTSRATSASSSPSLCAIPVASRASNESQVGHMRNPPRHKSADNSQFQDCRRDELKRCIDPFCWGCEPGTSPTQLNPTTTGNRGSSFMTSARNKSHIPMDKAQMRYRQAYHNESPRFNLHTSVPTGPQYPFPPPQVPGCFGPPYPQYHFPPLPDLRGPPHLRYPYLHPYAQNPFTPLPHIPGLPPTIHGERDYHAQNSSAYHHTPSNRLWDDPSPTEISEPHPPCVVATQCDKRRPKIRRSSSSPLRHGRMSPRHPSMKSAGKRSLIKTPNGFHCSELPESSSASENEQTDDEESGRESTLFQRRRKSIVGTSADDGEGLSNSITRRPTIRIEIESDFQSPSTSYQIQILPQGELRIKPTPETSKFLDEDEKETMVKETIDHDRSQSPNRQEGTEKLAPRWKTRSNNFETNSSNKRKSQIWGRSTTSWKGATNDQQNQRRRQNRIPQDSHPEIKHHDITQASQYECIHPEQACKSREEILPKHCIDESPQMSNGRDIDDSTSTARPLPEFVHSNRSQLSLSRYEELPSASHILTEKDDFRVKTVSDPEMDLEGPMTESRILSESIKPDALQQLGFKNSSTSSSRTHSSLRCFDETADSIAQAGGDPLEKFGDSEEGFEEPEISTGKALDSAMNAVKGLLLRELVDCALSDAMNALCATGSTSSTSQPSSASSSGFSNGSSSNSVPHRTRTGKRTRDKSQNSGDTDGDESDRDDGRPKKKPNKDFPDQLPHSRVKCPFYQRQPEKYISAACRNRGFADMAKLKDHIKRVHTQPLRCYRCWLELEEDTYAEHLQQDEACTKNTEPHDDRIPPHMLKRLDFKKSPYTKARNVEEKWKIMFSAIFPHDTVIPSPFEQHGMSPRLERALTKALEEELCRELAPIIDPLMSRIKKLIPAIIKNCRSELMRTSLSSSEEGVLTPSTESYGDGLDERGLAKSRHQSTNWSNVTPPNSSASPLQMIPVPESVPDKTDPCLSDIFGPSSTIGAVNTLDQGSRSLLEGDTDARIFFPEPVSDMMYSPNEHMDNYFDLDGNGDLFSLPLDFASDVSVPQEEGASEGVSAATSSNSFDPGTSFVP